MSYVLDALYNVGAVVQQRNCTKRGIFIEKYNAADHLLSGFVYCVVSDGVSLN